MLGQLCATAFAACLIWFTIAAATGLRRNLKAARESGLNYFIALLDPVWAYHTRYSLFAKYGDTFLVVSPWGLYLANASPSVIHQIATRRTDWVKPIEHYSVVEQFGSNVITTEGSTWRDHRKITSGSFNEKSNAVVWKESIRQAQEMIKTWVRRDGNGEDGAMWVKDVYPDAATTSMHIISRSGFGVKLLWPGEESEVEDEAEAGGYERFSSHEPKGEYTMTFKESMHTILRDVIWMGLFSRKWSERLPLERPKKVWEGYANLNSYLHELLELKKTAIKDGTAEKDSLDLMGNQSLSIFPIPPSPSARPQTKGFPTDRTISDSIAPLIEASTNTSTTTPFTTSNILGNAFIFLFAGHETTANSLTFLFIFLALNLPAQRRLQSNLDAILPSSPSSSSSSNKKQQNNPQEWPYPSTFTTLGNSYLGACINEQLRLIASVTMIPKRAVGAQTLVLDDGRTTAHLPPGTFQHFCVPSVHRNPRYWPHKTRSLRDPAAENDLNDFVPERWLLPSSNNNPSNTTTTTAQPDNDEASQPNQSPTISDLETSGTPDLGAATLFHPPLGAFLPFSHGPRACLGRRFAMVELVGLIATLLKDYSVELDVRDFLPAPPSTAPPSPLVFEELMRGMEEKEKRRVVYAKAQERAWTILERELGGLVTLQCVGRKVPLRFCRRGRGEEVFGDL
ncbi:MAG: hypothetical protein LQ350_002643 [Teloschistes chrysophthalmus]|nr:MAG: hypothetical protein LQ350_002643 [Niorma chrysophthalma]